MRILIGYEFSGVVREAFRARGHYAASCDLLPSEIDGPHYQTDIWDVLSDEWDMALFFPPCTHLSVSGARWWPRKRAEQATALEEVRRLLALPIPKLGLENPIGAISTHIRKPDQIIQPWMFGEDASKATCLWLKGLSPLIPTKIIRKDRYSNQTPSGQNRLGPSPDRAKNRSRTYRGIAEAMAEQWG